MFTLRFAKRTALRVALTVGVALLALGASAAIAAPKSAVATASVETSAGGSVDLQIWPGQLGKTAIITVVEVDGAVKLPATVRVPVVPGSTVEWAGEILGGPAATDIEQPFKLVQGQGGQFAEFTLTKSHRGQVDAVGFPLTVTSEVLSVSVDWVQSVTSPQTTISVRVPGNVSKVKIKPKPTGDPEENADGEMLYTLKPKTYKLGEKETISVSYSSVPPVQRAPGSEFNTALIVLGVALVIVVVGFAVLLVRQKRNATDNQSSSDDGASEARDETGDDAAGTGEEGGSTDEDEPDLDFD
jgi:hypothetical protein